MCSNSFVHLYADETVIYTSDTDLRQIQNSLQSDFNLVQKWLHSNKLILNRKKSCCMLFGTRHSRVYSSELQINFDNGTLLEKADSFKYLGLWIDPELSFKPHIDFIIKRSYGYLNSLYRSINCFKNIFSDDTAYY